MTESRDISYQLNEEEIKEAIREYVKNHIQYALAPRCEVNFVLKDVGIDDDRGPYRPIFKLVGANLQASFLE